MYTKDQLSKLFDSLINVIISVWIRSTPFFREPIVLAKQLITSHHFNFISDVIKNRERDLFNRITSDTGCVLYDLLPTKCNRVLRERGHDFILPRVKKE